MVGDDAAADSLSDVDEAFSLPLSVALADTIIEVLSDACVGFAAAETVVDLVDQ